MHFGRAALKTPPPNERDTKERQPRGWEPAVGWRLRGESTAGSSREGVQTALSKRKHLPCAA